MSLTHFDMDRDKAQIDGMTLALDAVLLRSKAPLSRFDRRFVVAVLVCHWPRAYA